MLLLGGNQGDREDILNSAVRKIEDKVGDIANKSLIYETAAWGFDTKDAFLNQVIHVNTNLSPNHLLDTILNIEQELGRTRNENEHQYKSRSIDIDILLFDDLEMNEPDLTIPHPRLHERMFALMPLAEIAGSFIHPVFNKSIDSLLNSCIDKLSVKVYNPKPGNKMAENEI